MKNKKKLIIFSSIILIIALIVLVCYNIYFDNKNFIKLSYDEILEKVNNKEDFVLCVSASECTHCKSYKPKLKKISKDYDIKIYYTDVDKFDDKDYDEFKEIFSFDGGTPTTIFFKEGEEKTTATRIEGDISMEKTIDKLKKNGFIE
ncbi:MAG: thioredoxin family protein [Bacilli bacterium]